VSVHDDQWTTNVGTQSGADGSFRVSVPAGTWTVTVDPPSDSTTVARAETVVTVASDGTVTPSPLVVRMAAPNVSGYVLEPGTGGSPIANAHVDVHDPD